MGMAMVEENHTFFLSLYYASLNITEDVQKKPKVSDTSFCFFDFAFAFVFMQKKKKKNFTYIHTYIHTYTSTRNQPERKTEPVLSLCLC